MALLPGSQYLVASVSDTGGSNWSIVIYVLDSRYNVVPIAKTPTKTKAYNLAARYLTVNGVPGITIAYVRRDWRRRGDGKKGIDVSDYSGEHAIDAPYPLKHECHTLHVPLKELETLCDPRFVPGSAEFIAHAKALPPPFRRVCFIRSTRTLGNIVLDELSDEPSLSIIRYPNSIMFKPLNGGPIATLTIENFGDFAQSPHRIRAIRPLPQQRQILVVREIDVPQTRNRYPVFSLEFHPIPNNATSDAVEITRPPDDFSFLYEDQYASVHITDHGLPNRFDDSIPAADLGEDDIAFKPRPINVFLRTVKPDDGLVRFTFYPQRVDHWTPPSPASSVSSSPGRRTPKRSRPKHYYRYGFTHMSPVRFVESYLNTQYRILPGSYRTLLYTVPWDTITEEPNVIGFYRYHDEELFADEPEIFNPDAPPRRPVRKLPFDVNSQQKFGAFAWDETIGRMCFGLEDSTKILVFDFARRPREEYNERKTIQNTIHDDSTIANDTGHIAPLYANPDGPRPWALCGLWNWWGNPPPPENCAKMSEKSIPPMPPMPIASSSSSPISYRFLF
ncbi:hypothetical protein PHLCEN_2v9810 [Hermanssonia centrifuga]|uniref:Uncharacterized protein n=1 Tax=Hermanssonia centrifuga TaxID=98765 RepID=A0A2R6NPQ7_9APHY|nr:hypothetical protein PHLCEN_2v9810 [Hermanssonia centrifuga]